MSFNRAKTVKIAEKFVKAGKLLEAVTEYKKLADDNPRDMNVINKLGDLLARAGKKQEAIRYFLRIAEFYAKDGFFLKAIAMYKKISKIDPSHLECLERLAGLYMKQGLMIEAKAQYLQVADQMVKREQLQPAADILPKVLEIDPDNLKVRKTLAELLVRVGKPEEAGREYARLARRLFETDRIDEALLVLRKGSRVTGAESEILILVLQILRNSDQHAGPLLAAAEEIAGVHKDKPLPMAVLGEACRRAGDEARAEKVFEHLSGLLEMNDAGLPEVAEIVARHHAIKGKPGESYEWTVRAVEGYREAARVDEAVAVLEEFLHAFADHSGALTMRADVASAAGDSEGEVGALRRLIRALNRSGETERARAVGERLRALEPKHDGQAALDDDDSGEAAPPQQRDVGAAESVEPPEDETGNDSDGAEDDVAAVELVVDEEDDDPAPRDSVSGEFVTGKVPAIEMEIEADLDESPAVETLLTIEEETDSPSVDRPAPPEATAADDDDLIGSEEQESSDGSSRIQEIQAVVGKEAEDEDFISEHFTEAEVFMKYGLLEKAKGQLRLILERYPRHAASHGKLKEIYVGEGDRGKAVDACLALADLEKGRGEDEKARDFINEAIRIDPGNARAVASAASLGGRARDPLPPSAAEREDDGDPSGRPEPLDERPLRDNLSPGPGLWQADPEVEPGSRGSEAMLDLPAGGDGGEMPLDFEGVVATRDPVHSAGRGSNPDAEKLGEVDFYIDQGLIEEARQVIRQLQKQYPGSAELEQRLQRLDGPAAPPEPRIEAPVPDEPSGLDLEVERALSGRRARAAVAEPPARKVSTPPSERTLPAVKVEPAAVRQRPGRKPAPVFRMESQQESSDGDFFDLASELDKSLEEAQAEADARDKDALEGAGHSFDDIFQAFKKGVEQQVDSEDYDTHYNLGIAYREMGLVDEAIGEFQFAAKDPSRIVECCGILGLCFRDKGMPDLALQWYRRGLDMPELGEQEAKGLRYDIAEAYRDKGDYRAALDSYTEVYGVDSNYREVVSRIKEMRDHLN
jgi:tetratricopeptide (TPR) repeat protein